MRKSEQQHAKVSSSRPKSEQQQGKVSSSGGCQVALTVLNLPTLASLTVFVGALFEVLCWEWIAVMQVVREVSDRPVCAAVEAVISFERHVWHLVFVIF